MFANESLTYPTSFLLCNVEIIEDKEGSQLEAACAVVSLVTMVVRVHIVMRRVLELMDDDAGGGHAGPLQQSHQVDHEGAHQLLAQR